MAFEIQTTDTEWREVSNAILEPKMKIKITTPENGTVKRTVNGIIAKPDSIHEVDSNTARNLIKKGYAIAADDEAKKINLEEPSRLTEEQADANAEKIQDKREADKEKADDASPKKKR